MAAQFDESFPRDPSLAMSLKVANILHALRNDSVTASSLPRLPK